MSRFHRSADPAVRTAFAVILLAGWVSLPARAVDDMRTERIQFAKGATSAVVEGTLSGGQTVDYLVGAATGQYMNVSMATDNGANYFNILAPGENEVAFFIGSTSGNQFEGTLPSTGDYRIRVYLMRSAARRNEKAHYRLETIVSGATKVHAAAASSPRVDATGHVPCAEHTGQPMGQCAFAVTRTGAGAATVVVTHPGGHRRTLYFADGQATRAGATGPENAAFSAHREGDLNLVRVGEERYEVPDAVVTGG